MPICRVEKTGNYTVMANYHLDDKALSLKARGLLSTMLRLPDDWDYTIAGLAQICKDGKAAIAAAIKELEEAGYITRRQLHSGDGTFAGNEYVIHEFPSAQKQSELDADGENAEAESAPLTDFPLTDKPSTENPLPENRTQPNTEIPSTKLTNPPISPRSGRRRKRKGPRAAPDWKPERFKGFWDYYPRGEGKQAAMDAWDKLQPDDELIDLIAAALKKQKASREWREGIGIPHASTYLNGCRWQDADRLPESGVTAASRAVPSRVVETQKVVMI